MLVLSAFLLMPVLCDICYGKKDSIIWQILKLPIELGKDVTFFCNASAVKHCCTNTATWMKDFDVIVHHGASSNSSKFIQIQQSDGFTLIIKHFNEDDINHQYTCLYDFYSYSAVLRIDRQNFKYIPNRDEIKANININSDKIISADIEFEKVYPPPECILIANEEKEEMNTNVTVEKEVQTGHFYNIKQHLVSEIHTNTCMDSISVLCIVGKDKLVIYGQNFTCTDNGDSFGSEEKSLDKKDVSSYTDIFLCAAVIVCVLLWWKMQGSSYAICSLMKDSEARSRKSVKFCRHGQDEESADIYLLQNYSGESEEHQLIEQVDIDNDVTNFMGDDKTNVERPYSHAKMKNARRQRPSLSESVPSSTNESENHLTLKLTTENEPHTIATKSISSKTDSREKLQEEKQGLGQDHGTENHLKLEVTAENEPHNIAAKSISSKTDSREKMHAEMQGLGQDHGDSGTLQLIVPAQNEKDVSNMIDHARKCDKTYDEKVASDTKMNDARRQRPNPSMKSFDSVFFPSSASVSDIDVLQGSSSIPTWGIRNRSRIRNTSKEKQVCE